VKKVLISAACALSVSKLINIFNMENDRMRITGSDIKKCLNAHKSNFIVLPYCLDHEDLYIAKLDELLENFDYFYPHSDEELLVIIRNKKNLKNFKKIVLSTYEAIITCSDKRNLQEFLVANDIPTPISSNSNANKIIKPRLGRGCKNIIKTDNQEIINFFLSTQQENFLVTDFINGSEFSVDAVFDVEQNNLLDFIIRKRVSFQSVSNSSETFLIDSFIEIIEKISKKLFFTGPVNFQFILGEDRVPYLIEINPRLSGGMVFSYLSGLNPFEPNLSDGHMKYRKNKNYKFTSESFYAKWEIMKIED